MPQKLYILPFDHRSSFIKMFGFSEAKLTPLETARLVDYKHIVYEGFLASLKMGAPKKSAAILVDEQFGVKILEEAKEAKITRLLALEKSGQKEFDFEYGDAFQEHIEKFKPEYVKVLVKYNPAEDRAVNLRQLTKLKTVSDFCRKNKYKFLFELLTEPLSDVGTVQRSMQQLQDSGIEPDIWKLEGLETSEEVKEIVKQARIGGRKKVGVVILGRGESDDKVKNWLIVAAKIPGVVGFAVGRTVFKQALLDYNQETTNREEAIRVIAKNYKSFVDLFENIKK
ncbi:MAG: DUF2090 domain-containing protein [Candidatus Nealsonbacteria bacterium]